MNKFHDVPFFINTTFCFHQRMRYANITCFMSLDLILWEIKTKVSFAHLKLPWQPFCKIISSINVMESEKDFIRNPYKVIFTHQIYIEGSWLYFWDLFIIYLLIVVPHLYISDTCKYILSKIKMQTSQECDKCFKCNFWYIFWSDFM